MEKSGMSWFTASPYAKDEEILFLACTRGTRFSTVNLMTIFISTVLDSRYC